MTDAAKGPTPADMPALKPGGPASSPSPKPASRSTPAATETETETAPALRRRLACMLYEGVLLFGVVMVAGLVFAGVMQQKNAMTHHHELQGFLFVVLGLYFTWFWSHGGQTVAMKTWRIRVTDRAGQPLTMARAAMRYVASWMWFMPALLALYLQGAHSASAVFAMLALGVVCYAAVSRIGSTGQYWHDVVCGTRLVTVVDTERDPKGKVAGKLVGKPGPTPLPEPEPEGP